MTIDNGNRAPSAQPSKPKQALAAGLRIIRNKGLAYAYAYAYVHAASVRASMYSIPTCRPSQPSESYLGRAETRKRSVLLETFHAVHIIFPRGVGKHRPTTTRLFALRSVLCALVLVGLGLGEACRNLRRCVPWVRIESQTTFSDSVPIADVQREEGRRTTTRKARQGKLRLG